MAASGDWSTRAGKEARGRLREMTQRRGSLKAPASRAHGAGAFRGLQLQQRALRAEPGGRAHARAGCPDGARARRGLLEGLGLAVWEAGPGG